MGVKGVGPGLQGLSVCRQFSMFSNNKPAEFFLPVADRPAIGQKPVFNDRFGVGRKLGPSVILISRRGFTELKAPLLEQVSIFHTANSRINMDVVTNDPMYDKKIPGNKFLLLFC